MAVSSIPDLSTPSLGITFADKVAHFGEYSIFGVLVGYSLAIRLAKSTTLFTYSILICGVFGILDEIHQHFIPGRTADPLDATADILGAAAGLGVYIWWKRRHS